MHWTQQQEHTSGWGITFLFGVMKWTSPWLVKKLVIPVAFYYFLISPVVRAASGDYLSRLQQFARKKEELVNVGLPGRCSVWMTFRHILSFAQSIVERVHAWSTEPLAEHYQVEGQELIDEVFFNNRHGAMILVSHLGNFDLAIACGKFAPQKRFNIVQNRTHTRKYEQFRDKIFKSEQIRYIDPEAVNPIEIISLIECVANGEVVIIAADRTVKPNDKSSVLVDFFGAQAAFPAGPYIMASLLESPVYCLFAFRKGNGFLIRFEMFEKKITISRKQRALDIKKYAQKYATRLESECLEFPLQWYNFYDFWGNPHLANQKEDAWQKK